MFNITKEGSNKGGSKIILLKTVGCFLWLSLWVVVFNFILSIMWPSWIILNISLFTNFTLSLLKFRLIHNQTSKQLNVYTLHHTKYTMCCAIHQSITKKGSKKQAKQGSPTILICLLLDIPYRLKLVHMDSHCFWYHTINFYLEPI